MAAPTLHELHETGEIDSRPAAHYHVNVRLQNRNRDNLGSLADGGVTQEIVQEVSRRPIDHRPPLKRRPSDVKVELVSSHADSVGSRCASALWWFSHAEGMGSARTVLKDIGDGVR
jgi:hypothetical protein